jgi:5-methylcytosine-specific restriction enzyme subunit McrC
MTTQNVNLTEWERMAPTKGSPLEGALLAGYPAAQRLAEKLTHDGRIEILELVRGLELRASSYVGRFALGELLITIKPKISGVPLMNLLRYAYRLRHLELFTEAGYATSQTGFEDLLIHQLAAESSELLSHGLHRDYLRTNSMPASPRGRVDFSGFMQVAANAGVALPCVHYPRSEDSCLNQVLHGGLELAARMTLDRELGGRVRRLAKGFTGRITPKNLDDVGFTEAWHSLDRRTSAYRPALTLIKILLNAEGAALTDAKSPVSATGFLFDMNRFFQALLSRFLGENLVGYEVQDERVLCGVLSYDPANNPRNHRSPTLRPDFLVLRNHKVEAVLDAKYRDLWENKLPREMLYQLALYALEQESGNRRATIIYPTLDDAALQQIVFVKDPRRGTSKAEIILRPINLLKLDKLLRDKGVHAQRNRTEFAERLAFGAPCDTPLQHHAANALQPGDSKKKYDYA